MSNKIKAEEEKNKGNECMKSQNPTEAVLHYTTGIKLDGKDHRLFSNRCLAFLQIQQYYLALQDAKTVIKLNPDWPKGYYRKGEVEYCTEHYADAIKSYEAGLALDSENDGILEAVKKSKKKLDELTTSERRLPWICAALGILVGTVIVLADHLVADNPMLQSMVLRTVFVVVFMSLGLLGSWLYKYMLQLQRSSLLEPPPDLGFGSTDSSFNGTQGSTQNSKRSKRKGTKT